ncbi:hypothetical protein Agabi119p4_2601 [Agaricus bisporus var. burnettii]|uniref:Uncharacterized protein n=1 Tax=Agaricus bisporus var. burnettii TaxID=192524 RepID=A0A8H7KKH5_AGABI|nr:hypothetical protein Agabi119p4_2601 [Agaricus bisporus var. burnettii]
MFSTTFDYWQTTTQAFLQEGMMPLRWASSPCRFHRRHFSFRGYRQSHDERTGETRRVNLVTPMFRDFLMLDFATQLVNACALVSYLSTAEFNYAPTSRQSCKNEIVTNYSPYSSYPQRPQTTASHISIVFRSLAHNVFNVRSHTSVALINFCEGIKHDTLISYLDPIVERLGLRLLKRSTPEVTSARVLIDFTIVLNSFVSLAEKYGNQFPDLLTKYVPRWVALMARWTGSSGLLWSSRKLAAYVNEVQARMTE